MATRADLASAEALLKSRLIARHQQQGVTFRDPQGTFLVLPSSSQQNLQNFPVSIVSRKSFKKDPKCQTAIKIAGRQDVLTGSHGWQGANVIIGRDTTIGVGVQIYGDTIIGEGVRIEGPTSITSSSIESAVHIRSFSVLEGAHVSEGSGAGPFARLREGTDIGPNSYVGNFVETKNARLGRNTLACHLTYLGDAEVGFCVEPESSMPVLAITLQDNHYKIFWAAPP